jgi:hypothetical protein
MGLASSLLGVAPSFLVYKFMILTYKKNGATSNRDGANLILPDLTLWPKNVRLYSGLQMESPTRPMRVTICSGSPYFFLVINFFLKKIVQKD